VLVCAPSRSLSAPQIKTGRGLAAVATTIPPRDSGGNKLKGGGPERGRLVNLNRLFLGANRIAALDGIQPLENLTVLSLQYATHTAHRAAQNILS
jgi:hypothetical protein